MSLFDAITFRSPIQLDSTIDSTKSSDSKKHSTSKKHSSSKTHDHLLTAPPKHASINDAQVTAYYALINKIGRASLIGSGYEHASHQTKHLKTFVRDEENLEARMWTEKDKMLSAITDNERDLVLKYIFQQALANKDKLNDKSYSIDIGSISTAHQHVTGFAELIKDVILPEMIDYVNILPDQLKQRPELFLNIDFYNHLRSTHHYLISPNMIESFVKDAHGQEAKILAPSLSYALEVVANDKAPELLNKKSLWRFIDPRNYVPYLHEKIRPTSYEDKYKKSSGIWQAVRKRMGWGNKHLLDEENIAEFNILNRAYKTSPETLESILSSAQSLYQYHSGALSEYEEVANTVIRNAKKLHVDTTFMGSHGLHTKDAYDASNNLHLSFMKNLGGKDPNSIQLGHDSLAILSMYKTHHIAMETYRSAIVAPLTNLRDGLVVDSQDNSHKTEGPLVRYGNYFEGTERLLNDSENGGFFYHLAYSQKEKLHGYIDKFGSVISGAFGKTSHENINRWKDILESGGHHNAIVRPNTLGKVYSIIGPEVAWWAGTKVYDNLKDNAAFFTPVTAVRQVAGMLLQGQWADLLSDAIHETEIPDNPTKVSVDEPDDVSDALRMMRPAYMTQKTIGSKKRAFGLFGNKTTSYDPTEDLHTKILANDFVADENNIPTLAAIGMLNVRRNDFKYAHKFLAMTNNWCKKARDLKIGSATWDSLASYELSILYGKRGEEELREEHLFNAFKHYGGIAQTKAPYESDTHDLETYCLMHPMNYESRIRLIKNPDSSYTVAEKRLVAHQSYSELETILTSPNAPEITPALRDRLSELKYQFEHYGGENAVIPNSNVNVLALNQNNNRSTKQISSSDQSPRFYVPTINYGNLDLSKVGVHEKQQSKLEKRPDHGGLPGPLPVIHVMPEYTSNAAEKKPDYGGLPGPLPVIDVMPGYIAK